MKINASLLLVGLPVLVSVAAAGAADLHPIVEVEYGYLFGATVDGKWIKANEAAKAIGDETTYRVYGLTQEIGEATGGKPKAVEDVCTETLSVSLSPKPEKGVIAWPRHGMRCRESRESAIRLNKFIPMRCAIF